MANPNDIIRTATELQSNHNKLELVAMARALGWRGDHARANVLTLALYLATKTADGEQPEQQQGDRTPDGFEAADSRPQDQPEGAQGGDRSQGGDNSQGEQDQQQQAGQQGGNGRAPQGEQQSQQGEAQGEQDQQPAGQQQGGDNSQEQGGEQGEQQQGDGEQQEREQDGQQDQQGDPSQQQEREQQDGQQDQQGGEQDQQEQQEQERDPNADDAEWLALLKAANLDKPHPLLRKVWTVASKAGLNPLLVGPAGTGKTMLGAQLAQLLRVPFGSISCTAGMSESQLTGWLLPVGEHGRFDYVPSPFVQGLEQPSVFLLDEVDAADPNVLLLLNSVMSNGFITIPHKLKNPTITRHARAIILAGANTIGGADDIYSARMPLDGATEDRFYPIVADYDESYEKSLFVVAGQKKRTRSAQWKPSPVLPTAADMDQLQEWFFALRKNAKKARIGRIVSSRMAQRLTAAVLAGVSPDEAKKDLLAGWSDDERARAQAGV